MSYGAKIIADSIAFGTRLTTVEWTVPRFILSEINTHRMISKNSASSRAIPVRRRIEQVRENPFVPAAFTKNRVGMLADTTLEEAEQSIAEMLWCNAAKACCIEAEEMERREVHKQHANRLLEPWAWHTVVMTSTEWTNFFNLRCHPAAQPEMQIAANLLKKAYDESTPRVLAPGEWHLPYVDFDDEVRTYGRVHEVLAISVARCAAVSYERQNVEKAYDQYVARHDNLLKFGHMSPFEHQAEVVEPRNMPSNGWGPPFSETWSRTREPRTPTVRPDGVEGIREWESAGYFCRNFRAPFLQYRATIPGESVFQERTAT